MLYIFAKPCYNIRQGRPHFTKRRMPMLHTITDLAEPDNGCEGFAEGEEPLVTLTLDDGRKIKVPDMLAYKMDWDIGKTISDEDIKEYARP